MTSYTICKPNPNFKIRALTNLPYMPAVFLVVKIMRQSLQNYWANTTFNLSICWPILSIVAIPLR